jgi:hypothetical protein
MDYQPDFSTSHAVEIVAIHVLRFAFRETA